MVRTASTGYAPAAVSPDSITAEVPSKIALATSLTSARVGVGLRCIESSIWVAVMTGRPFMTDYLIVNGKRVAVEPIERAALYPDQRGQAARYRINIGQRFHRVGYTAVIWQAMMVYRDNLGLHATLRDEAGRLDKKTLSASVLLDRSQYQLI